MTISLQSAAHPQLTAWRNDEDGTFVVAALPVGALLTPDDAARLGRYLLQIPNEADISWKIPDSYFVTDEDAETTANTNDPASSQASEE